MGKKLTKSCDYPPMINMANYQNKEDNIEKHPTKYRLIGLTEHVGRTDSSGHYTAHTLREDKWFKFDDEYFKQVSEKEALYREAYLLFY